MAGDPVYRAYCAESANFRAAADEVPRFKVPVAGPGPARGRLLRLTQREVSVQATLETQRGLNAQDTKRALNYDASSSDEEAGFLTEDCAS